MYGVLVDSPWPVVAGVKGLQSETAAGQGRLSFVMCPAAFVSPDTQRPVASGYLL